ncbi:hypothetical protein [Pseudobacteroides cellulosolvens]|uniref:Uncharacterized protein n=1 Tax=Pseudobacteroides cellulosolvens ATCC 35603 = DSM 2933 TaxID=398512 RepID=A0A0L6JIC3_9FIRM|nr:hypothetical protein [Pseudobacteroides cellulosolvens]KNY25489.1 hypothetical protein Bccel_0749 [Pseudobacteroides cellulosolvens ATCC 35603 = DSM 2933]
MGSSYCFECNNCEHKFFTSGPWEFRWNKSGKIEYCGHLLGNRVKQGVDGLSGHLFCVNCDTVSEIILLEYKKRVFTNLEVWGKHTELKPGYSHEEYKQFLKWGKYDFKLKAPKNNPDKKIRCPHCDITNLLFLVPYRPFESDCPKCHIGKIHLVRIDIS